MNNLSSNTAQQNLSVRLATRNDVVEIRTSLFKIIDEIDIYNETAKDYERELYTPKYLESLLEDDSHSILVAETADQRFCGFLITKPDNGPIWLCWFGVADGWRGHKIGGLLIEKMVEFAALRGIHKIWCDTRTSNRFSIPILTAFGFEKMCRLNNHWCNQDYYLWQKFVGNPDANREPDQ